MHGDQALDHLLVVLPLLLVRVVVAVGVNFGRQMLQLNVHTGALDSLHGDFLPRHRVLDHDDTLVESILLFQDDVGRCCVACQLLLRLVKHGCVL